MADQLRAGEHAARVTRTYQQALDKAEHAFQAVVSEALTRYEHDTEHASAQLERAIRTADSIAQAVIVPAQRAYDRQVKLATEGMARVLDPAHTEYDRAIGQAEQDWKAIYDRALKALEAETAAAQQLRASANRAKAA